jgi:hypothetical protein
VNIRTEDIFCVFQNRCRVIREDDFNLRARLGYNLLVIINVIHARENMLFIAEMLAEFSFVQHICIRVNTARHKLFGGYKPVADFVRGIAQH